MPVAKTTKKKRRRKKSAKRGSDQALRAAGQAVGDELAENERLARMAELSGQLTPYRSDITALERIEDEVQFDKVSVAVRLAVSIRKSIEEEADKILKPLNKALKEARAQKKKAIGYAEKLESAGRVLLGEYANRKREEQRQEAIAKAKKQAPRDKQFQKDLVEVAMSVDTLPETQGISTRSYVRGEVKNKAKLLLAVTKGKLPTELVKIDQSKLNAWAKLNPDWGEQHGVSVGRTEIIAVNSY